MTVVVAAGLMVLGLADGACSGFRSSAGRTGLINHRAADHRAARRGAWVALVLLLPAMTLIGADVLLRHGSAAVYQRAGEAMLAVFGPYALVVLAALVGYARLGWRKRYLASTMFLGPLTLLRPVVALLAAVLAVLVSHDAVVALAACLSVLAVLAVEPVADRLWYGPRRRWV